MIGSIIGDIAGSPFEGDKLVREKRDYHPLFLGNLAKFTDDTCLTIAVADALLTGKPFHEKYLEWHNKYPDLGYGSSFKEWAEDGGKVKNNGYGNGAAMRVSPIVLFAKNMTEQDHHGNKVSVDYNAQLKWALEVTVKSTEWTHNTEEARNGAMAVVAAGLLATHKEPKEYIRPLLEKLSGYNLDFSVETVRNTWSKRDIRCSITVPQALICFLESTSFEDAIRLAVYSKGDTDTIAAIAGGIAEQYYGVESINPGILVETKMRLPVEMIEIVDKCYNNTLKW
jgi:ADP-ribosylglycohydrolase